MHHVSHGEVVYRAGGQISRADRLKELCCLFLVGKREDRFLIVKSGRQSVVSARREK